MKTAGWPRYVLLAPHHVAHAALGHGQGGQRQRGDRAQHEQEDDHAHARLQLAGRRGAAVFASSSRTPLKVVAQRSTDSSCARVPCVQGQRGRQRRFVRCGMP